jgi:hypothetical protein
MPRLRKASYVSSNLMNFQNISIITIFSVILACKTGQTSKLFIPEEFSLAKEIVNKSVTLVYYDSLQKQYSYTDLFAVNNGNNRYLVQKIYDINGTNDSIVYINDKMIENYSYILDRNHPSKGNIIRDTILNNNDKLGRRLVDIIFETDSISLMISSESFYVKDTVLTWHNITDKALVISTKYSGALESKLDSSISSKFIFEITSYHLRKIGIVKMKTHRDNYLNTITLSEIKSKS